MNAVAPVRVLICDDHPVYRKGLRQLLEETGVIAVIGEAAGADEAVASLAEAQPDVVVMDLHMPGVNGVEATRRLLARSPGLGVLVLTMFEDDTSLVAALRAGARGYVVKGADNAEITRAIQAVANGDAFVGAAVASRLAAALDAPAAPRPFPNLTDREFEILDLLASGLATEQIARRLFVSPKTVRNSIATLMAKLGTSSRAETIVRARDAGVGTTGSGPSNDLGPRPADPRDDP